MPPVLLVVSAYLLGAVPWSFVVVRIALRKDVRDHGSGNVGATNAARLFSRRLRLPMFLLLFLLDAGKGYVAAGVLPGWLGMNYEPWPAVAAFCAVLGHCYTPYLRTLGGKGVATTIGALFALEPIAMLIAMGAFFGVYAMTRIVSASSLALAFALPIAAWLRDAAPSIVALTSLLGALILLRHSSNIRRLVRGTES